MDKWMITELQRTGRNWLSADEHLKSFADILHPVELMDFIFCFFILLSQGRNLTCVTNVAEGSTGWTICAPTSRLSTMAMLV